MLYKEIVDMIKEKDEKISSSRALINKYRMLMLEAESDLITAKLEKEKLEEELETAYFMENKDPPTYRDMEIEEFKKKLPELMKKIGG
jgi:hypothetical protein